MKPIHKFNNGVGATLCHQCNCIISLGYTEDLYCKECIKGQFKNICIQTGLPCGMQCLSKETCNTIKPKQRLEKYSERFDNKENELVEGVFNPDTWGKRIVEEPKQETLEEVAENYKIKTIKSGRSHRVEYTKQIKLDFISGAKWQQEQDKNKYSEEEVLVKLYECLGHFAQKHNIIINGNEIDQWFDDLKTNKI